ncbi:Acetyltransferase (GNAT) family [Chromobacterium vaccinii]|nr:Acetyltransferase (GNAT) family [Chromobacterium vaccinii]
MVAERDGCIVGYCFGEAASGEIVVLALLPVCEGIGVGKALLAQVMAILRDAGHQRLFLGCSSDPAVRSHGFYRYLGWTSTGEVDKYGDEMLEYVFPAETL